MTGGPALDAHVRLTLGAEEFQLDARLSLDAGVLVLFGPSAAGKTLTLKALAGLLAAVTGHVRVAGATLLDTSCGLRVPAHERRIGYVPQHQSLFPFLDVAGNVAFGLPRALRRGDRVERWLDELGIAHLRARRPESLSGGERQRVALARALAVEPRLLLLDEPFASIDDDGSAVLRAVVREVIVRHSVPAVLVTHDVDEALDLGDRVVRLDRGRTVETGTPLEILARARRVFVRGRIASCERTDGGRARGALEDATVEGPAHLFEEGSEAVVAGTIARGPRASG